MRGTRYSCVSLGLKTNAILVLSDKFLKQTQSLFYRTSFFDGFMQFPKEAQPAYGLGQRAV